MRLALPITLVAATAWLGCSNDSGPDTTAPTVASISPAGAAVGVPLDADVVVTFSEPVDPATVTPASVSLRLGSFAVPLVQTLENGNRAVRLAPTSGLGNNSTYTVTVSGSITDAASNPLSGAPVLSIFTTETANAMVADGVGDTYGAGAVQHDLTMFSGAQGSITITLQFGAAIQPGSAGAPNSMVGFVDIDVDQNGATGGTAATDVFRPDAGSTGLGIEYQVSLNDNPDGSLTVRDDQGASVGTVMPTFGSSSVTFTIPLAMLGDDDGNVNLATVIGTLSEPTDIAPNSGSLGLGVSGEPTGAALVAPVREPTGEFTVWSW